jgi:hypothetical protein
MITLKLTRTEFLSMILFLRKHTAGQEDVQLAYQSTIMLVLMDYLATWTSLRLVAWSQRRPDKKFRLSLKPVVARTLHQEMQHAKLTPHQQLFLNELDLAIVSHNRPSDAQVWQSLGLIGGGQP